MEPVKVVTSVGIHVLGEGANVAQLQLILREDGTGLLKSGERDRAWPHKTGMSVEYGAEIQWSQCLRPGKKVIPDFEVVAGLRDTLAPLLTRVRAGYETWWEGSDRRYRLTTDAKEASDAIATTLRNAHWCKSPLRTLVGEVAKDFSLNPFKSPSP